MENKKFLSLDAPRGDTSHYNKTTHNKVDGLHDVSSLSSNFEQDDESRSLIDILEIYTGNRRDAKALHKIHLGLFDNYFSTKTGLKPKTRIKYMKILAGFFIYSPTLDPIDLPKYLEFKFLKDSLEK